MYGNRGIWGTLFWVELRHKIDTNWGRWSAILLCWVDEFGLQHLMYDWEIR